MQCILEYSDLMTLRGWVTLMLDFGLNGYVSCKYLDRKIGEWLHYNFVAGSFHTKRLCSRLYLIEMEFYSNKATKLLFEPPFEKLRVNVCTPSVAHWKARG